MRKITDAKRTKARRFSPKEDVSRKECSIDNRCSWHVDFLTCFADPIQVAVQFMLELLLSSQFQEGLPVLHLLSLLRKLSTSVTKMIEGRYMKQRGIVLI